MDRDYYRSLTEAYQSIYEAPGVGAVLTNPNVLRGAGKIGGSMALQKLQNWPEYRQYRDQGYSEEEAAGKVASRLGLNVTGSILGSSLGSTVGPGGSIAGGVAGGPALVALVDALENEKTQKQKQYEAGVVWDDKAGKYTVKADNLTQDDLESDEAFAERKKAGEAMAKELNSAEGGPKAPTWLEYERRREKERAKEAADKQRRNERGETALPLGKSKTGGDVTKQFGVPNYTVSGIEYDGKTGRPVTPPPAFVPGQSRTPSASETETETETDTREISGYDKDGNKIYTDDVEQRNVESGATTSTPSGSGGNISGYTADGEPIRTQDVEDRNNQAQQKPEGMVPGKQNADGSNVTQTGKNDKGLTPYQQWAKNFPKLAAKVKPGQAGYDDIQAMNKATPAAITDPQPNADGKTGGGVVDGARRAASRVKDAAQNAANSNAGRRVTQATDNAIRATRRAAQRAAGSQAVRTVKDQAGKGLNRLNNAVRNRTGNNNNE